MKTNGHYELSDVPRLLERGGAGDMLAARAALLDAAEGIESDSIGAGRAMTAIEARNFDRYAAQIRDINIRMAEYKRQRIADSAGSRLSPVFPF